MREATEHSTMRIQSPLAFDLCLKVVCSILRQENLEVVSEALVREKECEGKGPKCQRLAVLAVWNSSYAYQALAIDRNAGLLMPFCLSVLEGGACSIVAASHHTRLAMDTASVEIRVLARVLDTKIKQIFLALSAHGSVHELVKQGGGIYRGIQYGSPKRGVPDLVLFDDPLTYSTLALALDGSPMTSKAVRTKISQSRKVFQQTQATRTRTRQPDKSSHRVHTAISYAI